LIIRGFKERYTQWIRHGENPKRLMNIGTSRVVSNFESEGENLDPTTDVLDDLGGKNVQNLSLWNKK
jgi:hypothetical protein